MNEFQPAIHEYIRKNRENIVNQLMDLIKIPSERGAETAECPFGRPASDVLRCIEKLYKGSGFETQLNLSDGYLLSFFGKGEKSIGLFSHADVVSGGDGWTVTQPFNPIEKDGFIFGRGALDDKSAVIISLYCAKLLKELNIPLKSRLVMFTGVGEETGMEDMRSYISQNTAPDCSLVLDTAFPVYYGNKGRIVICAKSEKPLTSVIDFNGGTAENIILGSVLVRLKYSKALYGELLEKANERITVTRSSDEIVMTCRGISKHCALPEGSLNAGFVASSVLCRCENLCDADRKTFAFTSDLLSDYYGKTLGISNNDAVFGHLTFCNGKIRLENLRPSLCFDIRYGSEVDYKLLSEKLKCFFEKNGWEIQVESQYPPHKANPDCPFVRSLLRTYEDFTEQSNLKPIINAGGTYARFLPLSAEIGTSLSNEYYPDLPAGHGSVHQPDENISIDGLLNAIEITLLMIIRLCEK